MNKANRKVMRLRILWLIVLAAPVWAQVQNPQLGGRANISVEQRFKNWDRNGDGKLTPDEVPGANLFKMLDKNGDGVVTKEEASAFPAGGRQAAAGSGAATVKLPPAENFKPRLHGEEAKAAGLKPDVLARIDVEIQRHVAAPDVAGIIALVSRHGKTGYFETFGMQDLEVGKPMPRDAIFRLQSMTKPIVAVAALTLYDEGKFALDEPISKHCPEWAEPQVLENGKLAPARKAITPRMLMSHSSGLYYGNIEEDPSAGGGAAAVSRGANPTLETYSKELAGKPLKFQPGEGYQYGTSIDVLGRYLEAVTGQPLDVVLYERVLKPLKMADTGFWVPKEKAARIAQLYSQHQSGQLQRGRSVDQITTKPKLFLGGQGLCSTAEDYAKFSRMLLNRGELEGVRILKPKTVDLMFQNQLKGIGQKYGLGGAVDGLGGYAWGGANGTQFWIDRQNDLFAIFMVQTQRYRSPAFNDFKRLVTAAITEGKDHGKTRKTRTPGVLIVSDGCPLFHLFADFGFPSARPR
jgi:CubicO group peptidase (beta-lactamase class C family)